jgi:ATP-dependent protease HslVU (ClpYQ) peptidase subunit
MSDDHDLDDATDALVNWFTHQNIGTTDAMVIMCRLMAIMMVESAHSIFDLRERVATISSALKNYSLCAWATK